MSFVNKIKGWGQKGGADTAVLDSDVAVADDYSPGRGSASHPATDLPLADVEAAAAFDAMPQAGDGAPTGTHVNAPLHLAQDGQSVGELPLERFFGTGVVLSVPKGEWELVEPEDLERATPEVRPGDIVIVNTGWHRYWGDSRRYFVESPGTYEEAGAWLAEKGVKGFGIDCQALDHPLGTAIGPQPNGPLIDGVLEEYKAHTGREAADDFPLWEPCHRHLLGNGIVGFENVGGEIDKVTGKRVTFAAFPWRWTKGDGCIVRLVAIVDPSGEYRLETGEA